jgi:hypothetical protein
MGLKDLSPIEVLQPTKGMKRKIFVTFSHTPKRLPNLIPLGSNIETFISSTAGVQKF